MFDVRIELLSESKNKLQRQHPLARLYPMQQAAPSTGPKIYVGKSRPSRADAATRWCSLLLAAGCLAVLVVASGLTPSRGGTATHLQLGMQPCGFLVRTGLPCPACGMTTSFAWFSTGNVAASFYVQPMGMVLAALAGVCVWGAGYVAVTGKPVYRIFAVFPEKVYLYPLLAMGILGWAWKMFIHLHHIDGWR